MIDAFIIFYFRLIFNGIELTPFNQAQLQDGHQSDDHSITGG
jgi:hypothetical protein